MEGRINHKLLKASGIAALIMAGAALLCGVLELCVGGMRSNLDYLRTGERWSAGGERYAVIGMYAQQDAGISPDHAQSWVRSIDAKLLEASVTPPEGGRSWTWCCGSDVTLPVTGTKSTVNARVMAVAGDFFLFHQLAFRYGGGFLNDNSNPMGIVLDRDLAWRVYGAENIVGMTVSVMGEEYVVVGITDRESSSEAYRKAYGDTPRMYMSYAGYEKVGDGNITFFEAALPNSVRGFAMNIFSGAVTANEDASAVIEATDRFSLKNRYANMKQLAYSWAGINRIEYPYWENEARVYDYRAAVMMLFEVALAAAAGSCLVISFILLRISGWTLTGSAKSVWKKTAESRAARKKVKPVKIRKTNKSEETSGQNPEKEV